jgi:SAM-dependent MidA family methyltransferase
VSSHQRSIKPVFSLLGVLKQKLEAHQNWLPFDQFMAMALYEPGLGYYAKDDHQFGLMPASGSDFVTAPELSPLFAKTLAQQIRQALHAGAPAELWELGPGRGTLALQLLDELGDAISCCNLVELSAALQARQRETLRSHLHKVRWLDQLPERWSGVLVGNEVLDAVPVQLLHFDGRCWLERGVTMGDGELQFADRSSDLKPPEEAQAMPPGSTVEIQPQAQALVSTLAERCERGMTIWIDYGFTRAEFYHPERHMGTLMCHQAHRADANPLISVGQKDITTHVDFTGIALAAQDAGMDVIGYTSQGRFLINCGLMVQLQNAGIQAKAHAQKLINEHEMGELFKVIAMSKCLDLDPIGFTQGDRSHRL